jgi:hypothetical protein
MREEAAMHDEHGEATIARTRETAAAAEILNRPAARFAYVRCTTCESVVSLADVAVDATSRAFCRPCWVAAFCANAN